MPDRPKYQRLPGRSGFLVLNRAYLGADHILAVQTILVREKYRRFFFRDIAAFSIHRTDRALAYNVIAVVSFLFCLFLAWALVPDRAGDPPVGTVMWGLFALTCLIWLITNLVLGPTCTCFVRTAVQTIELPSINRLRRAMKARALIIERVKPTQGEAMAASATTTPAGTEPVAVRGISVPANVTIPGTATPVSRAVAVRSLGATALGALAAAAGVSYDYIEPGISGALAVAAGVMLAMGAAITQLVLGRGGRLRGMAMAVAWAIPATILLGVVAAYVALIAVVTDDPLAIQSNRVDPFSMVNALPPGTNAVVDGCYLTIAALFFVVAMAGGVSWFSEHMRVRPTNLKSTIAPPGVST